MATTTNADRLVDEKMAYIRMHQPPQRPLSSDEILAMAKTDVERDIMLSTLNEVERSRLSAFQRQVDLKLLVGNTWPGEYALFPDWFPQLTSEQMAQCITYLESESFGSTQMVALKWYQVENEPGRFRIEQKLS